MKLQKIFWLLLLISVALVCTSCGAASDTLECFDFEDDTAVFDNVYQIDGKIVSKNKEANVIAVESEEADSSGYVKKTVSVYDLVTGKKLYSDYVTVSDNSSAPQSEIIADVSAYPLVQIGVNSWSFYYDSNHPDGGYYQPNWYYRYVFVGETTYRSLGNQTNNGTYDIQKVGNLYIVKLEDAVYWLKGDAMQEFHKDMADVANSYIQYLSLDKYFSFDAEYNGYLYAWQFDELHRNIMVFDQKGICAVQYNHPNNVLGTVGGGTLVDPKIHVLDNGNILVQECYLAEDGATYDFIYNNWQVTLKTKIIDYITGSVSEVDFDALILGMQSRYDVVSADIAPILPFTLNEGYANLVVYTPIADRRITAYTNVSVVDDSFNVVYNFVNDELSSKNMFGGIVKANEDYYISQVYVGGEERLAVYDYYGELVRYLPEKYLALTDEYVVINSGIYDFDGKQVLDFQKTVLAGSMPMDRGEMFGVATDGKTIYVSVQSFGTDAAATYAFNAETGKLELVADGINTKVKTVGNGYVVVYDIENENTSIVNSEGKTLLKVQGAVDVSSLEDVIYVETAVYGEGVVYVVNCADDMPQNENE